MKKKNESAWAPVKGYEGLYEVSTNGEVKSLNYNRTGKEKVLKPGKSRGGYLRVFLYKNGECKPHSVHRLVAEAFLDNPENLPCVNHKDENPSNNNVNNLEFCSYQYNINYGTAIQRRVEKQINGKKSKPVIALDPKTGIVVAEFHSAREAGRNGFNQGDVSACCRGDKGYKTHKGLIWCFKGTSDEEIDRRIAELLLCGKTPKERAARTNSKPVVGINPDTEEVVVEFPSMMEAQRRGFHSGAISLCCHGKRKSHKDLIWRYKEAS